MRMLLTLALLAGALRADSVPRDGFDLHYQTMGKGPTIVLLSGGPGFKVEYMLPVAERLADTFTCVLLEQRGTGRSRPAKVDGTTINLKAALDDLEALRVHLKQDTLTLVGHSWGGMLAMAYAAEHPDRVGRLLLVGPGGMDMTFQSYFGSNINSRLWPPDQQAVKAAKTPIDRIRGMVPGYFYNREKALEFARLTTDDSFYADMSNAMFTDLAAHYNVRDAMRELDRPVLIVQGHQDPVGESTAYEIHLAVRNSELKFLNECGHFPWIEQPEQFFKLSREFLLPR
jgi:proline iminopeptidase